VSEVLFFGFESETKVSEEFSHSVLGFSLSFAGLDFFFFRSSGLLSSPSFDFFFFFFGETSSFVSLCQSLSDSASNTSSFRDSF